jgi:hypothetical protein
MGKPQEGVAFGLASIRFGQIVQLGCLANAPDRHGTKICTSLNNPGTTGEYRKAKDVIHDRPFRMLGMEMEE